MNILKYGLHDTSFNTVKIGKKGISLSFNNGIYLLDENGKEKRLSKECNLKIDIDHFNFKYPSEHICISKIHRNRIREITIQKLLNYLKNGYFNVYLDFYSGFSQSMLIKGFLGKSELEILVSQILEMEFIFSDTKNKE